MHALFEMRFFLRYFRSVPSLRFLHGSEGCMLAKIYHGSLTTMMLQSFFSAFGAIGLHGAQNPCCECFVGCDWIVCFLFGARRAAADVRPMWDRNWAADNYDDQCPGEYLLGGVELPAVSFRLHCCTSTSVGLCRLQGHPLGLLLANTGVDGMSVPGHHWCQACLIENMYRELQARSVSVEESMLNGSTIATESRGHVTGGADHKNKEPFEWNVGV